MICPCMSSKTYEECCKPLLKGIDKAKTPEELMRSRFTAYARKNIDYIIKTTDSSGPIYQSDLNAWKKDLKLFCTQTSFATLTILETKNISEYEGTVTFFAGLMSIYGQDISFTEKSLFKKNKGVWYYHSPL